MDTPGSGRALVKWTGLIAGLMVVAVVLSLLSCLVLMAIPRAIDAVALRSLADQLGTEPSKSALVAHVTELLEDHKGSSREEVHKVLDDIGGFVYRGPYDKGNGQSQESANWTLAEFPMRLGIRATWSLRYDADDRLIEVIFSES